MNAPIHRFALALLLAALSPGLATASPQVQGKALSGKEWDIFMEAVATGKWVGCAIGIGVAKLPGIDEAIDGAVKRLPPWLQGAAKTTVACTAGAVAGTVIGRAVAEQQIAKVRGLELQDAQFASLLAEADRRNAELKREIDGLERDLNASKGKRSAQRKMLLRAQRTLEASQNTVDTRAVIREKVDANQARQLQARNDALRRDIARLERLIRIHQTAGAA